MASTWNLHSGEGDTQSAHMQHTCLMMRPGRENYVWRTQQFYTGQEKTYSAKASFGSKSEGSYGHADSIQGKC